MLRLHFINVADGDSVLLEVMDECMTERYLIDAGRAFPERAGASRSISAAQYLEQQGIEYLDGVIITHLHLDHFEGLEGLGRSVRIGRVMAAFFPSQRGGRAQCPADAPKTVRGLTDCLNLWAASVEQLRTCGTRLQLLRNGDKLVSRNGRLRLAVCCPETDIAEQNQYFRSLLGGAADSKITMEEAVRFSKLRNPNSLRLRLSFAGRCVWLAADCYGACWEAEELSGCDILKVPHHGDDKSVTPLLCEKLRPRYGIISCGRQYIPHKNRPSKTAIAMLQAVGTELYFTDDYDDGCYVPEPAPARVFVIREDGTILAPRHMLRKERQDK